tara:strand:- start:50 stop:400 length:351 start_codon:yes stop_codon:yes gene_type:complete
MPTGPPPPSPSDAAGHFDKQRAKDAAPPMPFLPDSAGHTGRNYAAYGAKPKDDNVTLPHLPLPAPPRAQPRADKLAAPTPPPPPRTQKQMDQLMMGTAAAGKGPGSTSAANYRMKQ